MNTQLAILYLKSGMFQEAEQHLRAAAERAEHNYTRPKDGEAYYYLGVALKARGKLAEAEDRFNRAAWSYAWSAPSLYALAEIACNQGDWARALDYVRLLPGSVAQ